MSAPAPAATLLERLDARLAAARASGTLEPIATSACDVQDGGVHFLVRTVSTLARRHAARVEQSARETEHGRPIDPFLPWDPALFVADLTPTHLALLNRFPVIDRHLLVVTRRFEHQECLLNADDFTALAHCLAAIDGLAFYNAGATAGASQMHKHLQLLPLPLAPGPYAVPIEAACDGRGALTVPFPHIWLELEFAAGADARRNGAVILSCYREALRRLGIGSRDHADGARQSGAYNLLLTRRWLMLVPRHAAYFERVAVNALGFAGALLVRDEQALQCLLDAGPMRVLQAVSARLDASDAPQGSRRLHRDPDPGGGDPPGADASGR